MLTRLLALLIVLSGPAAAHITEGDRLREIVLREGVLGTTVWVRAPLPLVFADRIAAAVADGRPLRSPFLYPERTGAGPRYRVDARAIAEDAPAFADRLAKSLDFARAGQPVTPELLSFRLSPRRTGTPFDSPEAARAALRQPTASLDPVFGEAVVVFALRLPPGIGPLSVGSGLPSLALPAGTSVHTHMTWHAGWGGPLTVTRPDQLAEPVTLEQTGLQAFGGAARTGAAHVGTGLGHALFILAFVIATGRSRQLLRGASVYLLMSAAALIGASGGDTRPDGWHGGAIETAGAVLIAALALSAWLRHPGSISPIASACLAAAAGLLHGLSLASLVPNDLGAQTSALGPAVTGLLLGQGLGGCLLAVSALAGSFALRSVTDARKGAATLLSLATIIAVAGYLAIERGARFFPS